MQLDTCPQPTWQWLQHTPAKLQQWLQALVGKHSLEVRPLTLCQGQVTLPRQLAGLLFEFEDASKQLGAVGEGPAVQDAALIRLQKKRERCRVVS